MKSVSGSSPGTSAEDSPGGAVVPGGSPDPRWPLLNRWSQPSPSAKPPFLATVGPPDGSSRKQLAESLSPQVVSPAGPFPEKVAVCTSPQTGPPVEPSPKQSPRVGTSTLLSPSSVKFSDLFVNSISNSTPSMTTVLPASVKAPTSVTLGVTLPSQGVNDSAVHTDHITSHQWPSLANAQVGKDKRLASVVETTVRNSQERIEVSSGSLLDQRTRFPWAAKMNQLTRNLHRTTTPSYLEDGTPKVVIPDHVFLKGLENQKEFVLGQFYRCSAPPGGLINAVVNRVWGRKCRIFTRKLSESTYLFHIPDESTRSWVLQRGLWHVDDCLMFVASWSPVASLELPEISTVPVWVTLKNIPSQLYSIDGIKWIASGVGEPMLTNKPRLDPTMMGDAKIMVEIELDRPFAQKVAATDMKGNVAMVDVEYSWIPSKCLGCGLLGHKQSRCLLPLQQNNGSKHVDISPPIMVLAAPLAGSVTDGLTPSEVSIHVSTTIDVDSSIIAHESSVMSHSIPLSDSDVTLNSEVILPIIDTIPVIMTGPSPATILADSLHRVAACHTNVDAEVVGILSEREKCIVLTGNRFNRLGSSFSEGNSIQSDSESLYDDSEDELLLDSLTPSGQRILRERPVQPSIKAKEVQASSYARGGRNRGRGPRGRGNRGSGHRGRGDTGRG